MLTDSSFYTHLPVLIVFLILCMYVVHNLFAVINIDMNSAERQYLLRISRILGCKVIESKGN